ncbi:MAG: hypothetical protein HYR67_07680 [Bacteroidetes bacterium]|nr:hypothetical protein [Bacteroidota bacterium]
MDIIETKLRDIQLFMKLTYGIVPIVAGADKFTNLLANWPEYLNPTLAGLLPFSGNTFMMIVGVIEIVAGILVLVRPKYGALVVSAWLVLIALTLLASGRFLDVAVRDVVIAVGAFMLVKLTGLVESLHSKQA